MFDKFSAVKTFRWRYKEFFFSVFILHICKRRDFVITVKSYSSSFAIIISSSSSSTSTVLSSSFFLFNLMCFLSCVCVAFLLRSVGWLVATTYVQLLRQNFSSRMYADVGGVVVVVHFFLSKVFWENVCIK